MSRNKEKSMRRRILMIPACLALLALPPVAEGKQIAIVASPESDIFSKITEEDVKNIYTGKVSFFQGEKITVAETKQEPLFDVFIQEVLKISESSYRTLWLRKVFSEGAVSPKQIKTPPELFRFIIENKNAIGFAWLNEVETAGSKNAPSVKILLVIEVPKKQGAGK